jgi:hypothetical protein
MPPSLTVELWRPDSGLTDHLHHFVVPNDVHSVKERIRSAGDPLPSFQRLDLVYETRHMDNLNGDFDWHTCVLYITLKDDETFLSNPYVYNQLMTKRVPHVNLVLSTFERDLNDLYDPNGEDAPDTLSIFCNEDVEITTHDDWWWFHNLLLMYGRQDYEKVPAEYDD